MVHSLRKELNHILINNKTEILNLVTNIKHEQK